MLANVKGVSLEGINDLNLLVLSEVSGRDDRDLLLLVELLVQLAVLLGDLVELAETLVLGEDSQELVSDFAECSSLCEGLIELADFFGANTAILGKEAEHLRVLVDSLQEAHVLEALEKIIVLRSSGEKDTSVAASNSILLVRRLVVVGRVNPLDVTNSEGCEEGVFNGIHVGDRSIGLFDGFDSFDCLNLFDSFDGFDSFDCLNLFDGFDSFDCLNLFDSFLDSFLDGFLDDFLDGFLDSFLDGFLDGFSDFFDLRDGILDFNGSSSMDISLFGILSKETNGGLVKGGLGGHKGLRHA